MLYTIKKEQKRFKKKGDIMWYEVYEDIKIIKELYRCHFTRRETAKITGKSYAVISTIFHTFENSDIEQYDRRQLSEWEGLKYAGAVSA